MSNQRVEWVDTLRGLGIFVVVYGHQQIEPEPSKYLQLVMVPLFYFASGLVFHPGKYPNYWTFFKRRFRALILPYLIYSVIAWAFWAAVFAWLTFYHGQSKPGLLLTIFLPLLGIPAGIAKLMPYNLPLWFLTCLFVTDSLFFLLQRKAKSDGQLLVWMILLSLLGFVLGLMKGKQLPLPWNADTALTVMVYYGAGFLIRKRWGLIYPFKWWLKVILCVAGLVGSIYLSTLNPQTHLMNNNIGKWAPFHLTSVASLVFFVMLAQLIAPTRIFGLLGRNTLPLLGLHVVMMTVWRYFSAQLFGIDFMKLPHTTPWALWWGTGTVLLIAPFIWLFNRYVPWAVGRPPRAKKGTGQQGPEA